MKKTGLTRKQIYKWFYEMKKSSIGQKMISMAEEDHQSTYNDEPEFQTSSDVESSNGSVAKPIFLVSKVKRSMTAH